IKPFIHRLICSYTAGSSLGMDATFKMAKQVTKSLARCLVSALSDMGHIVGYVAVPSEAWATLVPFLVRLRDRFKRLGKEGELKTVSTDTCCEGLARPENHLVAKLFPGVDRAPYGDNYHKAQILGASV
ncbi:unnamed protein product, partial [Laminaria digitata]